MVTGHVIKLHFSQVPAKFLHKPISMTKVFTKLNLDDIYVSGN